MLLQETPILLSDDICFTFDLLSTDIPAVSTQSAGSGQLPHLQMSVLVENLIKLFFFPDSFVNSQEWTLSRDVPELKLVCLGLYDWCIFVSLYCYRRMFTRQHLGSVLLVALYSRALLDYPTVVSLLWYTDISLVPICRKNPLKVSVITPLLDHTRMWHYYKASFHHSL